MHYRTLGTAKRNAAGEIINGVVLLHGTSGAGSSWLLPSLADELYKRASRSMPRSTSSSSRTRSGWAVGRKPSDGLRAKFPHYRYADSIRAEHQLITEGFNVRHLRLVLGSSMGGMKTWMWGESIPTWNSTGWRREPADRDFQGGRLDQSRCIRIEAIKNDPEYNGGNYTKNPSTYVYTLPMAIRWDGERGANPGDGADARRGDEMYKKLVEEAKKGDANNTLYGIEAVMDHDPSKELEKIKARLLPINFEDDEANPPQLNVVEPAIKRIKNARHVVIPAGPESHGHYSHLRAKLWKSHLVELMKALPKNNRPEFPYALCRRSSQPSFCSRPRRSRHKGGRSTATEEGFLVNMPGEPSKETIRYTTQSGASVPARLFFAGEGMNRYTMTVVNLSQSSAVDDDGTKAMAHEASVLRQRGRVRLDQSSELDGIHGHQLSMIEPDGRRVLIQLYYYNHKLYIAEGNTAPDAFEAALFQTSVAMIHPDGRVVNLTREARQPRGRAGQSRASVGGVVPLQYLRAAAEAARAANAWR